MRKLWVPTRKPLPPPCSRAAGGPPLQTNLEPGAHTKKTQKCGQREPPTAQRYGHHPPVQSRRWYKDNALPAYKGRSCSHAKLPSTSSPPNYMDTLMPRSPPCVSDADLQTHTHEARFQMLAVLIHKQHQAEPKAQLLTSVRASGVEFGANAARKPHLVELCWVGLRRRIAPAGGVSL